MSGSDAAPVERFQPPESDAGAGFWAATRDRRLDLQWCTPCDTAIHFPREACPRCLGTDLAYRPATGLGTIYAISVMPKPGNPGMTGRAPYAVALVDLDEGVRMLTNIVSATPDAVSVGTRVSVTWERLADGRHLPVFTPVVH